LVLLLLLLLLDLDLGFGRRSDFRSDRLLRSLLVAAALVLDRGGLVRLRGTSTSTSALSSFVNPLASSATALSVAAAVWVVGQCHDRLFNGRLWNLGRGGLLCASLGRRQGLHGGWRGRSLFLVVREGEIVPHCFDE
jgi:hypothetical protein